MADKKNKKDKTEEQECTCGCNCGEECDCGCQEGEECTFGCDCHEECSCEHETQVDYLDMAKRIQAEFDNYRKRTMDETEKAYQTGVAIAVLKFMPALDVLPKAIEKATDIPTKEGLEMLSKELENSLSSLGVAKIETKDKPFDASVANAVVTIENAELEDNIVVEELQSGYKFKNKVIRYAQVVVNKNNKKE